MEIFEYLVLQAKNGAGWKPEFGKSSKYKYWKAIFEPKPCADCESNHGKIWLISEKIEKEPPLHPNCRCSIDILETIKSGTATINVIDGADWTLKYENSLPEYYITDDELLELGWFYGDKVSKFAPNKMLTKQYNNSNGHLPMSDARIWYEADINYAQGKRNGQRVLWSNDGLVFVTFDHYVTFYEIV